ncbi:hypothetical protein M271_34360 [Streptomyces rapamycinicus NRRL 5491]|nr:hypothetical protein M271_34360 [Streptomyces rapamycinicus NRRL 5491]
MVIPLRYLGRLPLSTVIEDSLEHGRRVSERGALLHDR